MKELAKVSAIQVEGVYSHFSTAEDSDVQYRDWQLKRFQKVIAMANDILPETIYFHNTWDYNVHSISWNGSFDGMELSYDDCFFCRCAHYCTADLFISFLQEKPRCQSFKFF